MTLRSAQPNQTGVFSYFSAPTLEPIWGWRWVELRLNLGSEICEPTKTGNTNESVNPIMQHHWNSDVIKTWACREEFMPYFFRYRRLDVSSIWLVLAWCVISYNFCVVCFIHLLTDIQDEVSPRRHLHRWGQRNLLWTTCDEKKNNIVSKLKNVFKNQS